MNFSCFTPTYDYAIANALPIQCQQDVEPEVPCDYTTYESITPLILLEILVGYQECRVTAMKGDTAPIYLDDTERHPTTYISARSTWPREPYKSLP